MPSQIHTADLAEASSETTAPGQKAQASDSGLLPHRHLDHDNGLFLRQALSGVKEFGIVAELFTQLSDPNRIRVFWMLGHCEQCVVNIAAMLGLSASAVSHHLRSLRESDLILCRREGREVFYRAADSDAAQLLHQMIEQVMCITCPEEGERLSDCRADQLALVQQVHDFLVAHLEERITIELLSRRFHVNPTTLKTVFKSVYGNSIAAHIKEHRMERASWLLENTELSILEIARQVGYDSQSKFSAAFREQYGLLPTAFRKSTRRLYRADSSQAPS